MASQTETGWRASWRPFAALAALFLIWHVCSLALNDSTLPSPGVVAQVMLAELQSGEMIHHVWVTLLRVVAAFCLALGVGVAIGVALGINPALDRLFEQWLIVFLNLPALVIIVLAYMWFGLTEAAAIGAVAINKIPNVAITLREGAKALDPGLFAMARAYRWSRVKVWRHIIAPQLTPYVLGAARSGLALIWKIVLVVELLGRSDGVGFQIHLYFQLFDVAGILAYAVAFIIVVQAIEYGLFKPLERRVTRWRL